MGKILVCLANTFPIIVQMIIMGGKGLGSALQRNILKIVELT